MFSQRSVFFAAIVVFLVISTIGCISAAARRDRQWKKDFTYIGLVRTQFSSKDNPVPCATNYMVDSNLNWLQKAQCYMKDPSSNVTQAQKAQLRNSIIENFLALADKDFNDFEGLTTVNRNLLETGFDFINLGLTAATAVVGLGQTLGAAATGSQGAQHSFDKNFYNSQTAYVINNKMDELRLEQLAKIRRREAEPVACTFPDQLPAAMSTASGTSQNQGSELPCYSLEEAMADVQEYFYDGTTHKALQALINQTASQANTAKQALTTKNNQRISNPQPNPQINPVPPARPEAAPAPSPPPANATPPAMQ